MGPDPAEVEAHLGKLRASGGFQAAPRRMALLEYLVGRTLGGEQINEYAIGLGRVRQAAGLRSVAALLLLGLAFVLVETGWTRHGTPGPLAGSLVVLPFQNLSPDGQSQYLADGVTEELTNELAQGKDLRVVARTSAYQFKGKAVDIREVGRRLNVTAALEGSVAREGERVRITAQLNRTADGYALVNDRDNAIECLRQSAEAREGQILYLKYEPVFDGIRADPRYAALERIVGLEQ